MTTKRIFLQVILSLVFVLLICVPGVLLLVYGAPDSLEGEAIHEFPSPSVASWLDGSFQQDFEAGFSQRYPGRKELVEIYTKAESLEATGETALLETLRARYAPQPQATGKVGEVIAALLAKQRDYASPQYSEYIRNIPRVANQSPFRGTDEYIVGKDGVLYQNSYINEIFGFAEKYAAVTDAQLQTHVDKLLAIQQAMAQRDIAFVVMITPNKAAYYPEYVPEWYFEKYTMPEGYIRPYTRFLSMLEETGVNHLDSGTIIAENGITNAFPITGIHWNQMAAFAVTQEVIRTYQEQTGEETRDFRVKGIRESSEPFFREDDIYERLYAGRTAEKENSIVDAVYYDMDIEIADPSLPEMGRVWMQGGSFMDEVHNYLLYGGIAEDVRRDYYGNVAIEDWEELLFNVSYVVLEVNEQYVYNMGASFLSHGTADFDPIPEGLYNVQDSLYNHIISVENKPTPQTASRETETLILGKNDVLLEKETLNELYGHSEKYTDVTDTYLQEKTRKLAEIEQALKDRGIAFTVIFTPSKASLYEKDIPGWYLEEYGEMPEGYVRPYVRFREMLAKESVTFVDGGAILKKRQIPETFPPTGSMWNQLASLEISKSILGEYTRQTGIKTRTWRTTGVDKTKKPVPYVVYGSVFDYEQDLLATGGARRLNFSSEDPWWYYTPRVEMINENEPRYENILIHGGLFTNDLMRWIGVDLFGVRQYYDNYQAVEDWDALMDVIEYVVLEINEVDVYDMDGELDFTGNRLKGEYTFMESLYVYLMGE